MEELIKRRWKRVIVGGFVAIGAIAIILLAGIYWPVIEGTFRHGLRYEFPSGFTGWVTIVYEIPSCPGLDVRDGDIVIAVPTSGFACTSSRYPDGWRKRQTQYVFPDGRRTDIDRDTQIAAWEGRGVIVTEQTATKLPYEQIFIGNEDEFHQRIIGAESNWCLRILVGPPRGQEHQFIAASCNDVKAK